MKYKAQINNHFQVDVTDDEIQQLDVVDAGDGVFHLIKDGRTFEAKVVSTDFVNKSFVFNINGRPYSISLKDKFDQLVSKLGLEVVAGTKIKDVKAPMPGLVLDVSVNPGQTIEKGDKLLILEAMKMENVIKAEGEGIIKTVHIEKGAAVDKGQLLIEME